MRIRTSRDQLREVGRPGGGYPFFLRSRLAARPVGSMLAAVEIGHLGAVLEPHPVAQPVEPVGQDHLARCAGRHTGQVHGGPHRVAPVEVELIGVGLGEGVGLPGGHTAAIVADRAAVGDRGPPRGTAPRLVRPGTLPPLMKSTVEPLDTTEGNEGRTLVKLSVEVDEAEFDRDIDAAFRKIAREVRIPGFRPGKAPRRILEARIGTAPAREQALRDAIPQYLAQAVREHDVDIIATPEVDITAGQEDGPVAFDATVEVRPTVIVPGYAGLRVELPAIEVDDDDVDEPIEAERRRHGELVDVDRPAARGDFVTLDLAATRDGEPVPGLNAEDWLYEVGRGWIAEDFDEHLIGATAGDELAFTTTPTGTEEPADFTVAVKKVQELVLPELTDEWVAENIGEFDTVAGVARQHPPAAHRRPPRPGPPDAGRAGQRGARRPGRRRAARGAGQRRAAPAGRELRDAAPGPGHRARAVPGRHRPGPGRRSWRA